MPVRMVTGAVGGCSEPAVVESNQRARVPCYDLEFDDGTKVRCSAVPQSGCAEPLAARWRTGYLPVPWHCGTLRRRG